MDEGQHFLHTLFDGSFGFPVNLHTKADILSDSHIREKCISLKDHAHIALIGGFVGDINIINGNCARCGNFKTGDHPQGGGFSAARWSKERNKLAFFHLQIKILDSGSLAKLFGDIR